MIYQGKKRYAVRGLVLHTADVPTGWWLPSMSDDDVLDAFWQWHVVDNGWRKIGYHRIGLPNGRVLHDNGRRLRSIHEIGAHVIEANPGTIGYCMVNVRRHAGIKRFEDYFTPVQGVSARAYIAELAGLTDLKWVRGHNFYANKECPGFEVRSSDWMPAQ